MQKAPSVRLHVGQATLAARLEPLVLVTLDRELSFVIECPVPAGMACDGRPCWVGPVPSSIGGRPTACSGGNFAAGAGPVVGSLSLQLKYI